MSHGHSHQVEEKPGLQASSGIYLSLILAGFILGLIFFVKSMSASDHDTHGSEHHTSVSHADHTWDHNKPLEFSSKTIMGNKAESPVVEVAPVVAIDSTHAVAPVADSTSNEPSTKQ